MLFHTAGWWMTLSEAEIDAIVDGAADDDNPVALAPWSVEMRRLLRELAEVEFRPGQTTPLVKLCETGAFFGWRNLEATITPRLLTRVSPKAKASLTRSLRHSLEQLTRPCLELERTSFGLALTALGRASGLTDPKQTERMFLGDKPSRRLFSLFKKFPVLARLWCQAISQWREHVTEVLFRFTQDRTALSRTFFGGQPVETIVDFRCRLSDPHNHGRTVIQLSCKAGAVTYKPRPGNGEWEWNSLLHWMNVQFFRPKLRAAQVLRRKGYCWMEWVDAAPCKNPEAARRFYERMGGMIAAAYLLKAVDCHRDNLIASGEDPVLVDAETLWHVSPGTETQSPLELLSRTGFFPNSNSRSLQSRSSVLGRTMTGPYEQEMINGFRTGWDCILGTKQRRRAFARRLRRIQAQERRWIYRATEKYEEIRRASIQPAALRSGAERQRLIDRLCRCGPVASEAIEAEVKALERLDIPYFVRSGKGRTWLDPSSMRTAVCEALAQRLV